MAILPSRGVYFPARPVVFSQHVSPALNQLRHELRPEMERETEAVKVHHIIDSASRFQVCIQQFLLLTRHGRGEQFADVRF